MEDGDSLKNFLWRPFPHWIWRFHYFFLTGRQGWSGKVCRNLFLLNLKDPVWSVYVEIDNYNFISKSAKWVRWEIQNSNATKIYFFGERRFWLKNLLLKIFSKREEEKKKIKFFSEKFCIFLKFQFFSQSVNQREKKNEKDNIVRTGKKLFWPKFFRFFFSLRFSETSWKILLSNKFFLTSWKSRLDFP